MKLLFIGGTQFVGRTMAELAIARGHDVTLIHRGKTNTGAVQGAREILGDRNELAAIMPDSESWDAVIDVCGYYPRAINSAIEVLQGRAQHFTFISTISTYDVSQFEGTSPDEDAPLMGLEDHTTEVVNAETYGGLKVLCEQAMQRWAGQLLIIRPGLIVGPYDHTDRFTYWIENVRRGYVVAPNNPDQKLQVVDVRDLANFTLDAVEKSLTGTYNVVGPGSAITLKSTLELAREQLNPDAVIQWVTMSEERAEKLAFPLTYSGNEGDKMMNVNWSRAKAAGLTHRPLKETMKDLATWFQTQERDPKVGPDPRSIEINPVA